MKKLLWGLVIVASLISACGDGAEATPTHTPEPTEVLDAERVVVTTDKQEYARGELIKISVRNDLKAPLWYAQEVECGLPFWLLADCEGTQVPMVEHFCVWSEPQHRFTKLDLGETVNSLQVQHGNWREFNLTEPGCYKIVFPYSLEEKKLGWGGDRLESYSGEFTVR
jgi:hypothetical protein